MLLAAATYCCVCGEITMELGSVFEQHHNLWTHAQRASMLYFAHVFYVFFYDSLSWPNG